MKTLIGSVAFAATLAFSGSAFAGSVTVGSYDGGNCYPFLCNDSGTSSGQSIDWQEAYASSAFSGPITIDSLTFFFASQFGGNSNVLGGSYSLYLSYSANPVGSLSSTLANNVFGTQNLFASFTGGANTNPSWTINGTPFTYDPSVDDLLLEVVVTNQDNVPNGSGNGYNEADYTGLVVQRAYCETNVSCVGPDTGALVTEFNAPAAVPEPGTLALFGAGLLGLGALRRRRQKAH